MDEMSTTIDQVRIMARDSVNAKEKELTDMMNKKYQKIEEFVNENINDMVQERKATLLKYEKQFNQIKLVCCKYFEKYDAEIEVVKIKADNVMQKYQDWSKVLIEPSSLNDARLFSLEARVHQEEEIRIKEFDFMKDTLKKLIYSFEQVNIGQIDEMFSSQEQLNKSMTEGFHVNTSMNASVKKSGTAAGKNQNQFKLLLNNASSMQKSQTPILPNLLNGQ
jgi:hypothetical protein